MQRSLLINHSPPSLSFNVWFFVIKPPAITSCPQNKHNSQTFKTPLSWLQHQGTVVPLGRVYVQDPDDWDATAKSYSWRNPQAGFFLDTSNGYLAMAPSTPDGQ